MKPSNRVPGPVTPGQPHLPPALSSLLGPGTRDDVPEITVEPVLVRASAYGVRKVENGWEAVRYTVLPDGVKIEVVHQAEPHPSIAYAYAARAVNEEYARKSAGFEQF
jgi:hypothetical protein